MNSEESCFQAFCKYARLCRIQRIQQWATLRPLLYSSSLFLSLTRLQQKTVWCSKYTINTQRKLIVSPRKITRVPLGCRSSNGRWVSASSSSSLRCVQGWVVPIQTWICWLILGFPWPLSHDWREKTWIRTFFANIPGIWAWTYRICSHKSR